MGIEVEGPDGAIHEFPDGTSPSVIKSAMAKRYKTGMEANPLKRYWDKQGEIARAGVDAMTNAGSGKGPVSGALYDPAFKGVAGIGDFLAGAGQYLTSPITAAVDAFAAQPAERVAGGPDSRLGAAVGNTIRGMGDVGIMLADPALAGSKVPRVPRAGASEAQALAKGPPKISRAKPSAAQSKAAKIIRDYVPEAAPQGQIPIATSDKAARLARAVTTQPTEGAAKVNQAIQKARAEAAPKMLQEVQAATGANAADVYPTLDALNTARKSAAAPLYDEAYAVGGMRSEPLETLLQRPSMRSALNRAARIAAEEGRNPAELGFKAGDEIMSQTSTSSVPRIETKRGIMGEPVERTVYDQVPQFSPATEVQSVQNPTAQTWDYIKRGLDDVLEGYRDPVTGRLNLDEAGRAVQNTRYALRDELRAVNPKLGEAWDAYAGPTRQMAAMQRGRQLLSQNVDPELLAARAGDLSADELAAQQLGITRAISDRLRSGNPRLISRQLSQNDLLQERLAAGLNDPQMAGAITDAAKRAADAESRFQFVTGNSQTANKLQDIEAINDLGGGSILDVASDVAAKRIGGRTVRNQVGEFVLRHWDNMRFKPLRDPEVSDILAQVLTGEKTPDEVVLALYQSGKVDASTAIAMIEEARNVASQLTKGISAANTLSLPSRMVVPSESINGLSQGLNAAAGEQQEPARPPKKDRRAPTAGPPRKQ